MKKLLALAAVAVLGISMIGCGEPAAAPKPVTPAPAVTPATDPAAAPAGAPADPAGAPAPADPAAPSTTEAPKP
jgi:hypothetical protein